LFPSQATYTPVSTYYPGAALSSQQFDASGAVLMASPATSGLIASAPPKIIQVAPNDDDVLMRFDKYHPAVSELESQFKSFGYSLSAVYQPKIPSTLLDAFQRREQVIGGYGTSFLFYKNMKRCCEVGISSLSTCSSVSCEVCMVLKNGFSMTKEGGSGLFGDGAYFTMAPHSDSRGSDHVVVVAEVLLGSAYFPSTAAGDVSQEWSRQSLGPDFDSIYAKQELVEGLASDEFVVYDPSQAIVSYVCTFS
jgi:hypothetical protein